MTKPFGLEELAARVRTVLRRTRGPGAAGACGTVLYVAYLRRKLARYGPDLIHTQQAVGYSLRPPRADQTGDG